MSQQISKTKDVKEIVTDEMIERAMARGIKGALEDAHEFVEHVHTLWDKIADLYDEYVIALVSLGYKVSLKITDEDGDTVVEANLGLTKYDNDSDCQGTYQ